VKVRDDEVDTDAALVERLLAEHAERTVTQVLAD
jgi:hypothetical protein